MRDPLMTSVDLIRHAIADQVRDLGGDDHDIDSVAMSAAYAVWCWTMAEMSSASPSGASVQLQKSNNFA
jgi:hypothetical protein